MTPTSRSSTSIFEVMLLLLDGVLDADVRHHPSQSSSWLLVVLVERPTRHRDDFGLTLDLQRLLQRRSFFGFVVLRRPFVHVVEDR